MDAFIHRVIETNLDVAMDEAVAVKMDKAQHDLGDDDTNLHLRNEASISLAHLRKKVPTPKGLSHEVNSRG